jgi:TDG/mug DNA glycosylase family protein
MFWYLLSDAGLISERRDELRDDMTLRAVYNERFNGIYGLGFINIVNRPTRDITLIQKGEEKRGRKRILDVISREAPRVVCFVGKAVYEMFTERKKVTFGWQEKIGLSSVFVMHFPLRGKATVRVRELREVDRAAKR